MDSSLKNRPYLLIEFDKLLKFNQEALEGFIKKIDEEIIVVSIIGNTNSKQNEIANLLLGVNKGFEDSSEGIFIYTNPLDHNSKNSKILILNCTGLETSKFSSKILVMLHSISSVLILNTQSPNLNDLVKVSEFSKCLTGMRDKEAVLSELSPKLIFLLRNADEIMSQASPSDFMAEILKKDKNISTRDLVLKFYKDRRAIFLPHKVDNRATSHLTDSIFKESTGKNYKGKKINGFSLRNLFIEFVNCINQGSGINVNKM